MKRHSIPGQLALEGLPAPAPSAATARRHRTEQARAARRAHDRAHQWHRIAADFFRGLV